MTLALAEEAISARVSAVATANGVTLLRDNAPEPESKSAKWVRLRISAGNAELLSMGGAGNNKYRYRGQAVAEIHAPAKQGAATLRDLGDAITAQFRGVTLASPDIRFAPPTFGPVTEQGGWARRDATVAFIFDEVG